jgi:hypothetical protein
VPYDDGRVALDDNGVTIRWYYLWGTRRIPYSSIGSFKRRPMGRLTGKGRIWGSGDFRHWWNLDPRRPSKNEAIELRLKSGRLIPTITPDDPDQVEAILRDNVRA